MHDHLRIVPYPMDSKGGCAILQERSVAAIAREEVKHAGQYMPTHCYVSS